MPETVCVTVEQLREIERQTGVDGWHHWCPVCGFTAEDGHALRCWLGNAIAQAEKLKDWQPKVGERVRLKAMPDYALFEVEDIEEGDPIRDRTVFIRPVVTRGCAGIRWARVARFLAELMPEEGE